MIVDFENFSLLVIDKINAEYLIKWTSHWL